MAELPLRAPLPPELLPALPLAGTRIACIGAGAIGASWTALFATAGAQVALVEPGTAALERALATVPATGRARVACGADLAAAVHGADFVFECIPEELGAKQALMARLEPLLPAEAIVTSSSSALPISQIVAGRGFASRALVTHPLNPPHLVPMVEVCSAPETTQDTVARTLGLLSRAGREPVHVRREIFGFVANRLAMALFREAVHLVGQGVVSPADLDRVVARGLGLRWAAAGPCETYHLNQHGSFAGYFGRIAGHLAELTAALDTAPALDAEGLRRIAEHQDAITEPLAARRDRRDAALATIAALSHDRPVPPAVIS
jgi:3-hydroxyacyl-CoA dehydrogenase